MGPSGCSGWQGGGYESFFARRQFAARFSEALLHIGKFQPEEGGAGGKHEVEAERHESLVFAVDFAEAALGAVAVDGIADGGPGGDHAHAGGGGGGLGGTRPPRQEEGPAIEAAAPLPNGAGIGVAPPAVPHPPGYLQRP